MRMVSLDWKTLWNESRQGSLLENRQPKDDKWLSFWDSEATAYLEKVKRDEVFYRHIVDYLRRERVFCPGDKVLDIACGPGTYTLQFAPFAASVTALDVSAGMLSTMMVEAENRNLRNIKPVKSAWDQYAVRGKYDLVFTALSPAIKGPEEFLRMETCSSRSCCYITFGEEEQSRTRSDLWKILTGGEKGKKEFNISYPFNLLMSMGRKPNVRFFDYESEEKMAVDQLIEYYVKFFNNFIRMDEKNIERISKHINSISVEGYCDNWSKKSLVALFWDVE